MASHLPTARLGQSSNELITAGADIHSHWTETHGLQGDTHVQVGDYWRYEQDEMGAFSLQDSSGEEYVRATNGKLWVKEFVDTITVPIGFIYMQLPDQETPANLFGGTWQNISSGYSSLFFRVEGGSAAAFEQLSLMQCKTYLVSLSLF